MTDAARATILAVCADQGFRDKLGSLLDAKAYELLTADDVAQALDAAGGSRIDVVVLGPSVSPDDAVDAGRRFAELQPQPVVVGVLATVDTNVMRQAMRAGIRDVLAASEQTWAEVAQAVRDAAAAAQERPVASQAAPAPDKPRGKVISVAGMKGGVGKTTLATNIAAFLGKQGLNVALVDLDLQSGDAGVMMKLEPVRGMKEAAAQGDRLDGQMLEGLLTRHPSGARLLLAPSVPDDMGVITATRVTRVLDLLRDLADLIIIDTPAVWDETTLAATEVSDQIVAVTAMDVPSVKNTVLMLTRLRQLGRAPSSVKLVLNRADSKVLLDEKDVEKVLGKSITARIPSDRAVPRSVNKGVPIVMEEPRSGVARAIAEFATAISKNGVK